MTLYKRRILYLWLFYAALLSLLVLVSCHTAKTATTTETTQRQRFTQLQGTVIDYSTILPTPTISTTPTDLMPTTFPQDSPRAAHVRTFNILLTDTVTTKDTVKVVSYQSTHPPDTGITTNSSLFSLFGLFDLLKKGLVIVFIIGFSLVSFKLIRCLVK